jgi:hypothetical protein
MRNYFKQFTGKIKYQEQNSLQFTIEDEPDDLTDEIEKSLIEIRETWNIPEEEIEAAIQSRKMSKILNVRLRK